MRGTHVLAIGAAFGIVGLIVYGIAVSGKKESQAGTGASTGNAKPPDSNALQGSGSIASAHPADQNGGLPYVDYINAGDPAITKGTGGAYTIGSPGPGAAILGDSNADIPGE